MVFLISTVLLLWSWWGTSPDSVAVRPMAVEECRFNGTVLIIGAGASGLFAGYTLQYVGMENYQILEASDHDGGRVQEKTDFLDVPLDLGAEYIHVHPKILQDLILFDDVVNVKTISYQPQTYSSYVRGRRRRRNFFRHFYREYKFYNTTWYSYLADYVVPHVKSKITYNTVVQSIDYSNATHVKVTTTDGRQFSADKVIVTVPLAVMDKVQFIPSLPANKIKAMANTNVAPAIKVFIEFSQHFYDDVESAGRMTTLIPIYGDGPRANPEYFDTVFHKPSKRHCVTYFSAGVYAKETTRLSDEDILKTLLGELDKIYNGLATKYYLQHYIQNWAKAPYINGGYSIEWKNYDWTLAELARPVDSRVYFAGEHTEADQVATVHGAALSGRRAAELLLQQAESKLKRT
jgi:monoamine oxidase